MSPADLLRSAIERSGFSARAFATDVLLRDERTVRRWLAGDSPIPEPVTAFLEGRLLATALRDRTRCGACGAPGKKLKRGICGDCLE